MTICLFIDFWLEFEIYIMESLEVQPIFPKWTCEGKEERPRVVFY